MNSARTMPCVLVLPPRSKPPGFHRPRICCVKLAMIESTNSSSPGSGVSSASASLSSARCRLISAVTRRASGSRSSASNAGRKNGSKRRSSWISLSDVSRDHVEQLRAGVGGRDRSTRVRIHRGPRSLRGGQEAQGADAGQEEVGAAEHGDELRQAGEALVGAVGARDREAVGGRAVGAPAARAEQRIALVRQAVEVDARSPRRSARTRTGARCWRRGR